MHEKELTVKMDAESTEEEKNQTHMMLVTSHLSGQILTCYVGNGFCLYRHTGKYSNYLLCEVQAGCDWELDVSTDIQ